MKKLLLCVMGSLIVAISCAVTTGTQGEGTQGGYPGKWEEAVLTTDELGIKLIVIRPNEQMWELRAKTDCFWSRQYLGRTVWFKWGPVESLLMNEQGDTCEFWTKKRIDYE